MNPNDAIQVRGTYVQLAIWLVLLANAGRFSAAIESRDAARKQELQRYERHLRFQIDNLKREMAQIPAEHRQMIREAVVPVEIVGNPWLKTMAQPPAEPEAIVQYADAAWTPPEVPLSRRLLASWIQWEPRIIWTLWLGFGAAFALAVFGMVRDNKAHVSMAARYSMNGSHYWFFAISFLYTFFFAWFRVLPWKFMPWHFFWAPVAMLLAAIILRLGEGQHEDRRLIKDILLALAAPVCATAAVFFTSLV